MAQNTVNYANNPTGPELLDNYLAKEQENILSSNSGIQRPSYAIAGTPWIDTSVTPWLYKIYDGSEDVTIGAVNSTTHGFVPSGVDESNLVHKSETETITGSKIFSSSPIVPTATSGDSSTKAASTAFVTDAISTKANNNAVVHLTGNEVINGEKIFTSEIRRTAALSGDEHWLARIYDSNGKGSAGVVSYYTGNSIYNRIMSNNTTTGGYAYLDVQARDDGGSVFTIYGANGITDVNYSILATLSKSLSQNGYAKLSNGLTIQWMLTPNIYNYGTTITFPTPFTTTNYAICFNPFKSNPFNENATTVTERTTSTCKVYGKTYDGGSMSCPCFAIAIGY